MIKTILFDLDGTLLNTIDDLADAANWVCTQHGWPTFPVETYKHFVGNGIPKLVERFSPENARTPEQLSATLAEFSARYDAYKEDKTAPYPGIPELLAALKAEGVQTAVFSNKADAFCGKIIEHYFGSDSFSLVRGSRPGVPTKPDPAGVYSLMADLGADPQFLQFAILLRIWIVADQRVHLTIRIAPSAMPCHMSQCDRNTLTAKFIIFDVSCSQLSPYMPFFKGLIQGLRLNNGVSKFAEEHIELVQALTLPTPHTPRATSDTRHILSRNRFLILLRKPQQQFLLFLIQIPTG